MNLRLEVKPQDYVVPVKTIHSVEIQILNLLLHTGVKVCVSLLDINEIIIDNKYFFITGEDYALWNNNDDTLIALVLNKLGLEKQM